MGESETETVELCDNCNKNPAGIVGLCPYMQAKYSCDSDELRSHLCNCCDECYANCKMRSWQEFEYANPLDLRCEINDNNVELRGRAL